MKRLGLICVNARLDLLWHEGEVDQFGYVPCYWARAKLFF